jgi:hypothetical protein
LGEGTYSIPVPLPRVGQTFTFKKLKAEPSVRFTLLDRRVPERLKAILIVLVAAVLLFVLTRVISRKWKEFKAHLKRRGEVYGFLPGFIVIFFSFFPGAVLLLAACIHVAARRLYRRVQQSS